VGKGKNWGEASRRAATPLAVTLDSWSGGLAGWQVSGGGFGLHPEAGMRVVIDTDVLLSGLRSPIGASRIVLIGARERILRPVVNVTRLLEHEAVVKRPANLAATGLTLSEADRFLDTWTKLSDHINRFAEARPRVVDPNDAAFADAAITGLADALVTFNISHYRFADPGAGKFPVDVVSPGDVSRRLAWRPSTVSLSAFPRT
jgi:predicted nucleic acid-binding protein